MNAKQLFAAVAVFAAAGSAFANDTDAYVEFTNVVSTKTRAEVVAELKQAQAEGSYVVGGVEYPNQFAAASTYTVRQHAAAPVAAGKTRAEVIAELKQAQADGTYVVGGPEYENQVQVMARSSRGAPGIESAQKKAAAKATGG